MAHAHHHHHHHHDDDHVHEAPLDAASQSLADALRASFNVLKLIMIVLVILFLVTGVQCIDNSEEAVVLRFGRLLPGERGPGPSLAFPYPIDETLRVPVRRANTMRIDDHFIFLTEQEKGQPLSSIGRGGLDPVRDGALLTGDNGLVHVRWNLVYEVNDLTDFVTRVADSGTQRAERLIKALLDNAAIHVAASYTAEEITRHRGGEVAAQVKAMLNERLESLETGIRVVSLEIPESSAPIPTLRAFQSVSSAENEKQKRIREAEQRRDEILNTSAGAAYPLILDAIDALEAAQRSGDADALAQAEQALNELMEKRAAGEAQAEISRANSYYTTAVQGMQAALTEHQALLKEHQAAPRLLAARLWEETKRRIFASPEVTKYYLPRNKVMRVEIGEDPEQRARDEMERLRRADERERSR